MHFFQRLRAIPLYLSYFLRVVDLHSIQAPFAFNFYTNLLGRIKTSRNDPEIEAIRLQMQKDHSFVDGMDFGAGTHVTHNTGNRKVSSIARVGISSPKSCRFLSQLIKMVKPDICLELGTSLGITTAYLSRAMPDGKIISFEGNDGLAGIALENWNKLQCNNITLMRGDIDKTLPKSLEMLEKIDFAIIDANHTRDALKSYFSQISGNMEDGGVIFVDDINWSLEMNEGWQKIRKDPAVTLSLEFLNYGLLIFKEGISKQHYILSI